MKRKALILPVIAAGAALLAASSAQAMRREPLDLGCPSQTLGSIDVPADGATVSGYVQVIGYALDGNLVSNVDVFVDGTDPTNVVTVAGGANINLPRPDVMQFFPQYSGTAGQFPGYQASFKASAFSNGSHTVYVRITDVTGCAYFLPPRAVKIDNTLNQPPFGNVDFPLPDSGVNANGVLEGARHPREALRRHPHAADRVGFVRVEPRTHQHDLGPEALGERFERHREPARVFGVARTRGQRHVFRGAAAASHSFLVRRAGARKKGIPVHREVCHPPVLPE